MDRKADVDFKFSADGLDADVGFKEPGLAAIEDGFDVEDGFDAKDGFDVEDGFVFKAGFVDEDGFDLEEGLDPGFDVKGSTGDEEEERVGFSVFNFLFFSTIGSTMGFSFSLEEGLDFTLEALNPFSSFKIYP